MIYCPVCGMQVNEITGVCPRCAHKVEINPGTSVPTSGLKFSPNMASSTPAYSSSGYVPTASAPSTPAHDVTPAYASAPVYDATPAYASTPAYAAAPAYSSAPYGGAPMYSTPYASRPVRQLSTSRGLAKYIFLSLITFGIYGIVMMTGISSDINIIASRYDGKKTMNYCLVYFIFSWLTIGIVPFVWTIKISARVGRELERRGINYGFGASTFWLWNVLGSLIVVGPFIYYFKFFKSMNLLAQNYNING